MAPVNESIAYYDPGDDLSCHAEAAITGRRFVVVSDPKQAGSEGLAANTLGGNIVVSPAGADGRALGVATYDAAAGAKVPVMRGHKVVTVDAGAAIVAGAAVSSDATGRAVTAGAGPVLGICLNSPTAAGQAAIVALNL